MWKERTQQDIAETWTWQNIFVNISLSIVCLYDTGLNQKLEKP